MNTANKNKLIFLNHASFAIEQDSSILLIDPYFEGRAFFNGWSLLDKQTNNDAIIKYLTAINKKVFIWYSHEHSDHLSISFIKCLKQSTIRATILYQKTLDKRVITFFQKQGFKTIECVNGKEIVLNGNFKIYTWSYLGGDSYSLINSNGTYILNINDCVIDTQERALLVNRNIKNKSLPVDILLTQFGYANWIGNENDFNERKSAAIEKFKRIKIQAEIFEPRIIIPFASFVFFCHSENFYLNDFQNSPASLRSSKLLEELQNSIKFMKPWDTIKITNIHQIKEQLNEISKIAEKHWNGLQNLIEPIPGNSAVVSKIEIIKAFISFKRKMTINFLFLPQILELLGFIKPLNILITDLKIVCKISYISEISFNGDLSNWNISLSSPVLEFILKNEFGFNTTCVNGRYRIKNSYSALVYGKFFSPQEYYKNGYGVFHPLISAKVFLSMIAKLYKTHFLNYKNLG